MCSMLSSMKEKLRSLWKPAVPAWLRLPPTWPRGTDIVLGGGISKALEQIDNDETLSEEQKKAQKEEIKAKWQVDHDRVVELGGLRIIGSERHESRRIDNQLRGRSGRQGDPGSSRFYLSMEDPLLRIFAGERCRL